MVERCKEDIESAKKACDEYAADERALDAKIKKKKNELERHEKRLSSLQNVRPAFMDEYEKLEGELQKQYSVYLERFRNLDYLQAELQTYHAADKAEVDEHDRNLKRMQKRLREEELRILRGEQEPVGSEASKKMMDGWCCFACSKRRRSCRSASPTHLLRQSAPLRMKNATGCELCCEQVLASARATSVLPQPGGP